MWEWGSYMMVGVLAGTIAGLFGVGGGLIIVPLLVMLFGLQGVNPEYAMHMAIATSLMTIVATSLTSIAAHARLGHVDRLWSAQLTPGLLFGAVAGAWVVIHSASWFLEWVFISFVVFSAVKLWRPITAGADSWLLRMRVLLPYSVVAGGVSAIVGIGGGTLIVPYLAMAGARMQRAIGTAAWCGLPIALAGALSFIVLAPPDLPLGVTEHSGLVYWPAFWGIISTSILFAPLGARLAHHFSAARMKRLFSLMLVIVALFFLYRTLSD